MLELNRLKPMPEVYDQKVFNRLYANTENLRRKLASEIDSRRFGLSYEDILSFFDVKFIYVFEKHHEEPENIILAFLINSLKNFKCRILKAAYTIKYSQSIINVDDVLKLEDNLNEDHPENFNGLDYFHKMMEFMREHLSMNAYTILDLQLNPPPYMLSKLNLSLDSKVQKIPDHVILDYLDLGNGPKASKYLDTLKKEIKNCINYAKLHFNNPLIS